MFDRFNKPAGQRPVNGRWQVQDSNLRRHTPTDLQSARRSVVTCGYGTHLPTSPQIPHDQRHIVSDSWTHVKATKVRLAHQGRRLAGAADRGGSRLERA